MQCTVPLTLHCKKGKCSALILQVLATMDGEAEHLYLLVHNIDGVRLRGDKCQDVLAALAGHPKLWL